MPQNEVDNVRNNMYLASEAIRLLKKSGQPAIAKDDQAIIDNYKQQLDHATKFIPTWVKVAVAIALFRIGRIDDSRECKSGRGPASTP